MPQVFDVTVVSLCYHRQAMERFSPNSCSHCFLSVSPWLQCCVRLAGLVFLVSPVLPPKLAPSGLGSCVRLAGLVFLLSPDLSPSLSPVLARILCPPRWSCLSRVSGLASQACPIWSGILCPPCWSCLSLVSRLVSQLVSRLG